MTSSRYCRKDPREGIEAVAPATVSREAATRFRSRLAIGMRSTSRLAIL
jgi:hypothetical protein